MLIEKYPWLKTKKSYRLYAKFRKIFDRFLSYNFPTLLSKLQYRSKFGRKLNLKNPIYFNEKLMWLKFNVYTNNKLVTECIDKYLVRNYVRTCGLDFILNDLLGVWDNVSEIQWHTLPNKFVIKCNHGCGFNIICKDKSSFDIQQAKKTLEKWMCMETWPLYAETNYRGIQHKIICEKYLDGINDALPVDYKIYCFNGEPLYIGNFIERNIENDSLIRGYFNIDWTPSNIFEDYDKMDLRKFPKPSKLNDMINYARILSKPFPFVRVDFYEVKGKVYFGELTFTPTGCLGTYYTKDASIKLGEALDITNYIK